MKMHKFTVILENKEEIIVSSHSAANAVHLALRDYYLSLPVIWNSSAIDESYDEFSVLGKTVRVLHDISEAQIQINRLIRAGYKVEKHPTLPKLLVQDPVACSHGAADRWLEHETVEMDATHAAVTQFLMARS